MSKLSPLQEEYASYFFDTLKDFNVDNPSQLSDADRTKFFDTLSKGWEKGEGEIEANFDQETGAAINAEWVCDPITGQPLNSAIDKLKRAVDLLTKSIAKELKSKDEDIVFDAKKKELVLNAIKKKDYAGAKKAYMHMDTVVKDDMMDESGLDEEDFIVFLLGKKALKGSLTSANLPTEMTGEPLTSAAFPAEMVGTFYYGKVKVIVRKDGSFVASNGVKAELEIKSGKATVTNSNMEEDSLISYGHLNGNLWTFSNQGVKGIADHPAVAYVTFCVKMGWANMNGLKSSNASLTSAIDKKYVGKFDINKDNWSGENDTVIVKANGTFTTKEGLKGKIVFIKKGEHEFAKASEDGDSPITGYNLGTSEKPEWHFEAWTVSRQGTNPYITFVQLLHTIG